MKKDVLINIHGIYSYDEDEESDEVELFTMGTYQRMDDHYLITYEESEATGFHGSETTLKVGDDHTVVMSRSGDANAQIIIQDGIRNQCQYNVGFGDVMLGVNGHFVKSSLDHTGGDVSFKYSLDINAMLASENEMTISIKERAN